MSDNSTKTVDQESKKFLDNLVQTYGFNATDPKWIMTAGEILEYVGIEMIGIEFKRSDVNSEWTSSTHRVVIKEISDYDPMLGVYKCKYRFVDTDKSTEWRETQIIPEGFSLITEASTWMIRFVPFSIHSKMAESEAFASKLKNMYDTAESLSIDSLTNLAGNKDNLLSACNIGILAKIEDKHIWIRISHLNIHHDFKDTYTITIKPIGSDKSMSWKIRSTDTEHSLKFHKYMKSEELGKFKVIDLSK